MIPIETCSVSSNTDLRFQYQREWYVEVGQRHTREGVRPRRGDIWNPISFNEVFAPTKELDFLTFAAFAARSAWPSALVRITIFEEAEVRKPTW